MALIAVLMTLTVIVTTLLSCASDVRGLRIPNAHSAIILAAFVPAFLSFPQFFQPFWSHIAALFIVFILGYILFAKGIMGGGDSKLGAALALWVGVRGLMAFVFYWGVIGGVLAGLTLYLRHKKPFENPRPGGWIAQAQAGANELPYGIAISAGAWLSFLHMGLLHKELNEVFKIIH